MDTALPAAAASPPVGGTGCLGRSAVAACGAPDAAAMLAAMADAAAGELRPRQPLLPLSACCCCSAVAGPRPSNGVSSRPQTAPTPICSSAMAPMPSSRVGSGMAASVDATCACMCGAALGWVGQGRSPRHAVSSRCQPTAVQRMTQLPTLLNSIAGMSSSKLTCSWHGRGAELAGSWQAEERHHARPSQPAAAHAHPAAFAQLALLMTVAVLLGMRPVFSSQPTAAQMRKSLKEALVTAASTAGSMAACSEAAAACAAATALAAAPTPPAGRAAASTGALDGRQRVASLRGCGGGRREGRRRAPPPPRPVGRQQHASDVLMWRCCSAGGSLWMALGLHRR